MNNRRREIIRAELSRKTPTLCAIVRREDGFGEIIFFEDSEIEKIREKYGERIIQIFIYEGRS